VARLGEMDREVFTVWGYHFKEDMVALFDLSIWGISSNRVKIYSKPPPKRPLGVIFRPKTAKKAFQARMLREILAYNTDCMQASAVTACISRNKQGSNVGVNTPYIILTSLVISDVHTIRYSKFLHSCCYYPYE
jgi:hypothetical protein